MKALEMNQMEMIEGGLDCSSSLGVAAGLFATGIIIGLTGGTAAALIVGVYGFGGASGYFAGTAPCFSIN